MATPAPAARTPHGAEKAQVTGTETVARTDGRQRIPPPRHPAGAARRRPEPPVTSTNAAWVEPATRGSGRRSHPPQPGPVHPAPCRFARSARPPHPRPSRLRWVPPAPPLPTRCHPHSGNRPAASRRPHDRDDRWRRPSTLGSPCPGHPPADGRMFHHHGHRATFFGVQAAKAAVSRSAGLARSGDRPAEPSKPDLVAAVHLGLTQPARGGVRPYGERHNASGWRRLMPRLRWLQICGHFAGTSTTEGLGRAQEAWQVGTFGPPSLRSSDSYFHHG